MVGKGSGLTYFANRQCHLLTKQGVGFERAGVGCRTGAECRMGGGSFFEQGGGFEQPRVAALVVDGRWLPNNHRRRCWASFRGGWLLVVEMVVRVVRAIVLIAGDRGWCRRW